MSRTNLRKGIWVHRWDSAVGPNKLEATIEEWLELGFDHVIVKIADGTNPNYRWARTFTPEVVARLRRAGLYVWGFHWPTARDPELEAQAFVRRAIALGVDGILINAEAPYANKRQDSKRYCDTLINEWDGRGYIGFSSYAVSRWHGEIAWTIFGEIAHVMFPQVYPGKKWDPRWMAMEALEQEQFGEVNLTLGAYPALYGTAQRLIELQRFADEHNLGVSYFSWDKVTAEAKKLIGSWRPGSAVQIVKPVIVSVGDTSLNGLLVEINDDHVTMVPLRSFLQRLKAEFGLEGVDIVSVDLSGPVAAVEVTLSGERTAAREAARQITQETGKSMGHSAGEKVESVTGWDAMPFATEVPDEARIVFAPMHPNVAERLRHYTPTQLSPHFHSSEFARLGSISALASRAPTIARKFFPGGKPLYIRLSPRLVQLLEDIRARFGPTVVLSGYRPKLYNEILYRHVLGRSRVVRSYHCDGLAADIRCPEANFKQLVHYVSQHKMRGGLGISYKGKWLHVDVRGYKANWTYGR